VPPPARAVEWPGGHKVRVSRQRDRTAFLALFAKSPGANFAMSRARKGRSPDQIRKDRAEVARLYLEGRTQADIGAQLGLSRQQIGYDLGAVRQEWLRSSLVDFNA